LLRGVGRMSEQEWAKKCADEIILKVANNYAMIEDCSQLVIEITDSLETAFKQIREIGRLETNKGIKWPAEIPEERIINARDERGDLIMHVEYEWLKQFVEAINK